MARSFALLQFNMWRKDDHHRATPPRSRLMYHTILLDETVNQAGVVRIPPDYWAADSGMEPDDARAALDDLAKRNFVVMDGYELLVRTLIRNDGIADQPNILRSALRTAAQLRSPVLRRALAAELRRLPAALPPKPLRNNPGKLFYYPDPHACADELDPDGRDPDAATTPSEGYENPSGTLPGPVVSTTPSEGFGNPSRTGGGGGGGGGVSSPGPVNINSTLGKRAAREEDDHAAPTIEYGRGSPAEPLPESTSDEVSTRRMIRKQAAAARTPAALDALATSGPSLALVARVTAGWELPLVGRVKRQWAACVYELLREGIPESAIEVGMRACAAKGYGPNSLGGFVFGEANRCAVPAAGMVPATTGPGTSAERANAFLALIGKGGSG